MTAYRSNAGDILDVICLNHYGSTHRYVEGVLMSNPGLASQGPILPAGIMIKLPDLTGLKENKRMIRLWD